MGHKTQSQFTGGQTKAQSGSQPISQHPLFPAIVALWFGAAFGLASLAIRPSLIEHAVVAGGIDKIIPMAAPPLGTTTRILISLAMTALGGVIGSLAARRLARPAAAPQARRRGPAAEPIEDRAEPEAPVAPRTFGASRRRALALHEDNTNHPVSDHAPLPGQQARILNLAEFDLDGFEDAAAQASDVVVDAPAPAPEPEAFEAPAFTPPTFTPPAFVPPAPVVTEPTPAFVGRDRDDDASADQFTPRETAPALKVLENRLFQTYAREIKARADDGARARSAPLFGAPVPVVTPGFDLLPRIGLGEWGEETEETAPVADHAAEPQPLFAPPAAIEDSPAAFVDETPAVEPVTHFDQAPDYEPDTAWAAAPDPIEPEAPEADAFAAPVCEAAEQSGPSAADRIAHAELDALSHVELLERLALAMEQQRRLAAAAREAVVEPAPVEAAAPEFAPPAAAPFEGAPFAAAPFEAAPFEAAAPQFDGPQFNSPQFNGPEMVADPLPTEAPAFDAAPEPAFDEPAPFVRPQLPLAMRPLAFDEPEDDEALPGYHPPRHILRAPDASAAEPVTANEPDQPEAADDISGQDEDVLEAGYSSLLDLSRPAADKPRFVRIEEPESVAIEPVVIFPGEGAMSPPPFAAPSSAYTEAPSAITDAQRSFDRPGSGTAPATPADTEKALRAALATLQRMSGAA
ncbi:hypothetical protein [Novosphingobium colocasiae]|uniref:hypothetical protein n=1 Tax=Novosphingobium colocasiae TaxID=1256513 RepID=UPI0035B01D40